MKKMLLLLVALAALVGVRIMSTAQNSGTSLSTTTQGSSEDWLGKPWYTYGTKTDTSDLTLQVAPTNGSQVTLTEAYCLNTSAATAQSVTITYGSTTVAVLNCPPGPKYQEPTLFDPPLRIPANTLLKANATGSVSTTYIFAEGTQTTR